MDHDSKVTISSHSAGQLNNPAASISKKLGTSAWGIPLVGDGHQLSNNANLFSSSLPLLQHEKCTYKLYKMLRLLSVRMQMIFGTSS
uniref:Protein MEI2-like 2 isoform X2 n=1 Tax=Rhizophora mucronata TaxID=61149 RepID=A0A2P2LG58_RHIMU